MKKLLCLLLALILCLGLLPAGATAAAPVEVQLTQALLCCTLAARALPGAQAPVPPDPANRYLAFTINIFAYVLTEPVLTRTDGKTCLSYTAWTIHGRLNILETGAAVREQGDCIVLAANNDGATYSCTGTMLPVAVTYYDESDRLIALYCPALGRDYVPLCKMPERTTLLNVDSTRHIGLPVNALDTVDADDPWVNARAWYDGGSDRLCIIYDVTNEWDR